MMFINVWFKTINAVIKMQLFIENFSNLKQILGSKEQFFKLNQMMELDPNYISRIKNIEFLRMKCNAQVT